MCGIGGGNARVENVGPEEHALVGARAEREAEEPLKRCHHFSLSPEPVSVSNLCRRGEENVGVNACSHRADSSETQVQIQRPAWELIFLCGTRNHKNCSICRIFDCESIINN